MQFGRSVLDLARNTSTAQCIQVLLASKATAAAITAAANTAATEHVDLASNVVKNPLSAQNQSSSNVVGEWMERKLTCDMHLTQDEARVCIDIYAKYRLTTVAALAMVSKEDIDEIVQTHKDELGIGLKSHMRLLHQAAVAEHKL